MASGKSLLSYLGLFLLAIYWVPAIPYPDQTKASVNVLLFLLALIGSGVLSVDMIDIIRTRGDGLSWQALLLKVGLFDICTSFGVARIWAMAAYAGDFPDWMLHSPIGSYFTYLLGLGLLGVVYGFSSAGDVSPKITLRGFFVVILAAIAIVVVLVWRFPF